MNLFFDLDSSQLVTAPGTRSPLTALSLKRGDNMLVRIRFLQGGGVVELAAGATGKVGLKAENDFDGDYVAFAGGWTKVGTGPATVYTLPLDLNTAELDALLGVGAAPDVASVRTMFELEFVADGIRTSSQTIRATVHNDVNRGDEGSPSAVPSMMPLILAEPPLDGIEGVPEGVPHYLRVTGELTKSDGTTPEVFPLLKFDELGDSDKPSYIDPIDGAGVAYWSDLDSVWYLSGPDDTWESSEDVASPDLVTTWTPSGSNIGTPIVTAVPFSPGQPGRLAIVDETDVYVAVAQDTWSGPLAIA